jgi:hypothetical protein
MHNKLLDDDLELDLNERSMSGTHKNHIALAHRGSHQSASTKSKISSSLAGKPSNHKGKKQSTSAKNDIANARGTRDPIGNKAWVVNSDNKTYRKTRTPVGFKKHKRHYSESAVSIKSFKEFISE